MSNELNTFFVLLKIAVFYLFEKLNKSADLKSKCAAQFGFPDQ